jgi:hypothetical protein
VDGCVGPQKIGEEAAAERRNGDNCSAERAPKSHDSHDSPKSSRWKLRKDPSSASRSGCSSRGVAAHRAAGDLDSRTMGVAPMVRAVSSGGDTATRSAFSQVQRRSCDWIGSAVLSLR